MSAWAESFRGLGQSILGVMRAEVAAIEADLKSSGHRLGVAAGLLAGAGLLVFWAVGLLVFAAVALLDVWLPLWGAALIVFLLFGAGAALLSYLGVRHLRQLESPVASVRQRISNHLDWWQNTLLAQPALDRPGVGERLPPTDGIDGITGIDEEDFP